jgi:hypothetical protein
MQSKSPAGHWDDFFEQTVRLLEATRAVREALTGLLASATKWVGGRGRSVAAKATPLGRQCSWLGVTAFSLTGT